MEDEEILANLSKVAQVLTMVHGPFVSRVYMATRATLLTWSKANSFTIASIESPLPAVLIFDSFLSPRSFLSLPTQSSSFVPYPLSLKSTLESRYKLKVHFRSPDYSAGVYELYWVHFRGNTQVVYIATLQPGEEVVQYTSAGHLYMLTGQSSTPQDTGRNNNFSAFDYHIHLPKALCLLLMPAINIPDDTNGLLVTLTPQLIATGMNLEILREYSSDLFGTSIKDILLTYWQLHRQVCIPPSMWALKPLYPSSPHTDHFPMATSPWLFTRFFIPPELLQEVKTAYLLLRQERKREMVNGTVVEEENDKVGEGFISLVFNQYIRPTFQLPLPPALASRLSSALLRLSEKALSLPQQSLSIVSSYGVREYGQGAVVRAHVDPPLSSPLTAILHIHSDCQREKDQTCWPFHVPSRIGVDEGAWWVGGGDNSRNEDIDVDSNGNTLEDSSHVMSIEQAEGEVLLLHTAQLPHARLLSFTKGTYYGNFYVHMKTADWGDRVEVMALE
eukprot:gene28218-34074_t